MPETALRDWSKPYDAGYYAWTYLREDLSRAEVTARMPELLALEQFVQPSANTGGSS
ncbi:MAG: hypothetical protein KatS3mg015_2531 [Fimbriimonadales bacterium]|nr:MAG: hypothetical protein KatS3mg015_2531 [Fimbriimonadales bacterium]